MGELHEGQADLLLVDFEHIRHGLGVCLNVLISTGNPTTKMQKRTCQSCVRQSEEGPKRKNQRDSLLSCWLIVKGNPSQTQRAKACVLCCLVDLERQTRPKQGVSLSQHRGKDRLLSRAQRSHCIKGEKGLAWLLDFKGNALPKKLKTPPKSFLG